MADDYGKAGDDFQALIIHCGDLAYYWPGCDNFKRIDTQVEFQSCGHVPVYWIGRNHEDWDQLDMLGPEITEIEQGVFYCT